MVTLRIYDPAMCCSSGVCGSQVDPKLIELAAYLKELDAAQVTVERYNLSQQPEAYAANPAVTKELQAQGVEALPLVFVNDTLVSSGDYPSTQKLTELLSPKSES